VLKSAYRQNSGGNNVYTGIITKRADLAADYWPQNPFDRYRSYGLDSHLTRLARRLEKIFLKGREDEESLKRARTLSGMIKQFLNSLIVIIAVMTVLAALDIQIGPLLATAV